MLVGVYWIQPSILAPTIWYHVSALPPEMPVAEIYFFKRKIQVFFLIDTIILKKGLNAKKIGYSNQVGKWDPEVNLIHKKGLLFSPLDHRWDLPVLRYHKIMVIYHYPFVVVITQLFSCIIFINGCICILTGSPG